MAPLDVSKLTPIDTSGLKPVDKPLDVSGLEPLDVKGLVPIDEPAQPAAAPPSEGYGDAVLYGLGQPLRNIGTTARVLGAETLGGALEAVPSPQNYQPASERVLKPQEGDFTIGGLGVGSIPRAAVEQSGQLAGSVLSRVAGASLGAAVAGPPGAAVGALAAPTVFGAAQVIGTTALERAKANGRTEPNRDDILAAIGTGIASGAIDAASVKYLTEAAGPVLKRFGLGALTEGGTEALQSVIEQTGGSLGTEQGLDISPKQAIAEGLIGAGPGGIASAALGDSVPQKVEDEPPSAGAAGAEVPPAAPVPPPEDMPAPDAVLGLQVEPDAAPVDVQVQRYFTTPEGDTAIEVRGLDQQPVIMLVDEFKPLVTQASEGAAARFTPAPPPMPTVPDEVRVAQLDELSGRGEPVMPAPAPPSPQGELRVPDTKPLDTLIKLRTDLELAQRSGEPRPGLSLQIREVDNRIAELEAARAVPTFDTTTGEAAPRVAPLPGALGAAAAQGRVGVSAAEVPVDTTAARPAPLMGGTLKVAPGQRTVAETGVSPTQPRAPTAAAAPTGTPLESAAARPGFVSAAEVPLQTGRPTTAAERQRQKQLELERSKPVVKPTSLMDALRKIGLRRDDPALNDLRNRDALPKGVFRKDGKTVAEALTILENQGFPVKPSGVEQYTAQDVNALSDALDNEVAGRPVFAESDAEQGARWQEQQKSREQQAQFESEWGTGSVGRARYALSTEFGIETDPKIGLAEVNRLLNQKLLEVETDEALADRATAAMDRDARAVDDHTPDQEEFYDPFEITEGEADTGRVTGRGAAEAPVLQPQRQEPEPEREVSERSEGPGEGAGAVRAGDTEADTLTDEDIDAAEEAAIRAPQQTRQPMMRKTLGKSRAVADKILAAAAERLLGKSGKPMTKQEMMSTTAASNAATPGTPKYSPAYDLPSVARLTTFAQGVAANNQTFADYHRAVLDEHARESELIRQGEDQMLPAFELPEASKAKINKVLEHDRLTRTNRKVGTQRVVVEMPANYQGELAKPGDVVTLSKEETKALGDIRKYLNDRWDDIGKSMLVEAGYTGAFSRAAIEARIASLNDPQNKTPNRARELRTAKYALEVFETVEKNKRTGYVPFMRHGDVAITIIPRGKEVEGKDGIIIPEGGLFTLVESNTPWWSVFGRKAPKAKIVNDKIAELEKKYPPDKYEYKVKDLKPSDIDNMDISMIEKMFMAVNLDDQKLTAKMLKDIMQENYTPDYAKAVATYAREKLIEEAREQIYKRRISDLLKESRNVPGYDTNFFRSLADYNRMSAVVVTRREQGQRVRDAYEATQKEPPGVAGFAKRFNEYLDSDESLVGRLKQFGFWANIWGSPSSAIVNLIQTPTITAAQIGGWGGARAWARVNGLIGSVGKAMRIGKEGVFLDYDKLQMSPAERADFMAAVKSGLLDPTVAQELQGDERSNFGPSPDTKRFLGKVFKAGASMFNTAEQINRAVAWLAAYRTIQDPKARAAFNRMYAKDKRVQTLFNQGRDTPADIARFVVEDTQFIGGKFDRPEALRGIGGVAFQFKQYPLNYMRLLYGNFKRMGPEGRTAGLMMITTMLALSGLLGLPFAEDVLNSADAIGKFVTKVDPMLERELRNFIGDPGWAETILRGPSRSVTGIDLSKRFGVGEIAPEADLLLSIPILGATYGRLAEFKERSGSGQPVGAGVALAAPLVGKGPADLMRGLMQLPEEGLTTRRGDVKIAPDKITGTQMGAKSVGLQPAKFARVQEEARNQQRLRYKTQDAENALRSELAGLLARSISARKSGEAAEADKFMRKYQERRREALEDFRKEKVMEDKIRVPTVDVVRRRALQMLNPELRNKTAAKTKRRALAEEDAYVSGDE